MALRDLDEVWRRIEIINDEMGQIAKNTSTLCTEIKIIKNDITWLKGLQKLIFASIIPMLAGIFFIALKMWSG